MGYINIHRVELEEGASDEAQHVPEINDGNQLHSLANGEELLAAARLLKALDDLGDGEALVIWRDFY
ncbi:MAG: hypothetical protein ACTHON_18155 [Humibacter sp.]